MSSIANNTIQYKTITVDLSKIAYIDGAAPITTASLATAVGAGREVLIYSMNNFFGMNSMESVVICDVVVNRLANSPNIVSNSVNAELRVQRVNVTAGLNTLTPTIADPETVVSMTLNAQNRNTLNTTRPMPRNIMTSIAGSLSAGDVSVRDSDRGDGITAGGALVVYGSAPAGELSGALTNAGVVNITIGYKNIAR